MILFKKKDIESYLVNGIYHYNDDYTQLLCTNAEYKHFTDYKTKKDFKYLLKRIFRTLYRLKINSNIKVFDGLCVLRPSNKYGYKFFSNSNVLTLFEKKDDMNKYIKNKSIIGHFYKTPKTIMINNNYLIEEKINTIFIDKSILLSNIIEMYSKKIEKIEYSGLNIITHKIINTRKISEFDLFYKKILIKNDYLCALQHGDLWSSNVLCPDKNEFYIIDYENVGYKYLLFDFFTFIYNEALLINDYSLIDLYISGYFDNILENYLKNFRIKYKSLEKQNYFNIFLNELLEEKFEKYDIKTYKNEISKMISIYDYFERRLSNFEKR